MERSLRTVLLLRFLTVATLIGSCNGNLGVSCKEGEKQALLMFKQDLKDPANRLLSWAREGDCCNWTGVVCDNLTGHIRELQLGNSDSLLASNSSLSGKINPSLLNLKHLTYLNLSNNNFQGTQIPSFFGSLKSLSHLDLLQARFYGMIPHQLGNLSSLRYLRVGGYPDVLKVNSLQWISGLSQLKHLEMSHVNLSKASDWLQMTNILPSLVELHLSGCGLDNIPPLHLANFTSLVILDLSQNYFNSLMPGWVFSLRNLVSLNLNSCSFHGPIPSSPHKNISLKEIDFSFNSLNLPIPEWLFNQKDLTHLDLSYNSLKGPIPGGFSNLTSLKFLSLESNFFNDLDGEVLSSIGNLTSLYTLLLSYNQLGGDLQHSLGNLCNLMYLDLSFNNFHGNVSEFFENLSACSSYRIKSLWLGNNNLSGHLTLQTRNIKNLSHLDLSGNSISGHFPVSLVNLSSLMELDISDNHFDGVLPEIIGHLKMLTDLDISYNSFQGVVSEAHFTHLTRLKSFIAKGNSLTLETHRDWLPPFQLENLVLDSWHLGSELPMWLQRQKQLHLLSLSNTGISGTIPNWFWNSSSQFSYLNLSHNQLHGEIKYIAAEPMPLSIVDLSSNQFNGSLPLVSSNVYILDLSNSSFSGSVFHFFCHKIPHQLSRLYIGKNLLGGKIPDCWRNWQELEIIDLENNNFIGNIPSSIGHLVNLRSLHLRNNHLSGEFPLSMQNCTNLLVIDFGGNRFVGSLATHLDREMSF